MKTTMKAQRRKAVTVENDVEKAKEREVKRKEREEKKKRELEKLGSRERSQTDAERKLVHIESIAASNKWMEAAQVRKTLRRTG
jgi:hypothetical protein